MRFVMLDFLSLVASSSFLSVDVNLLPVCQLFPLFASPSTKLEAKCQADGKSDLHRGQTTLQERSRQEPFKKEETKRKKITKEIACGRHPPVPQ